MKLTLILIVAAAVCVLAASTEKQKAVEKAQRQVKRQADARDNDRLSDAEKAKKKAELEQAVTAAANDPARKDAADKALRQFNDAANLKKKCGKEVFPKQKDAKDKCEENLRKAQQALNDNTPENTPENTPDNTPDNNNLRNKSKYCGAWGNMGYCCSDDATIKTVVTSNCEKKCSKIDCTAAAVDNNVLCKTWADDQQCAGKYATFLKSLCPVSCQ